jgi:hypothetical protein
MGSALLFLVIFVLASAGGLTRQWATSSQPCELAQQTAANPEMEHLEKALVGEWDTLETMERTEFFPNGGARQGVVHARPGAGGSVLIYEVHSDGPAGKLDGFHTIWWDKSTKLYYFFACFNSPSPCRTRGTAHWQGSTFVNDYQEEVDGKPTECRDTFVFTQTSHTLTAEMRGNGGHWRTIITTKATRR